MALTPEQIDAMAERIVHGAEERMVAELAERLCARLAEGVMGLAEEASLEALARSVRAEAERIVADHADAVSEDVRRNVRDALDGDAEAEWRAFAAVYGAEAAAAAAARLGGGATAHFAELSLQAAEGVARIIARDNIAMAGHAADEWIRIAGEASDAYVQGLKPLREIMAGAVAEMAGAGISAVDYKSGVSNQPDVAVRRHAITQAGQAGGRMTIERCEAYGHELVITSAHYGARPTHAVWQGKPCAIHGPAEVDGAFYPGLSELTGYGTVGGLKGANCRHMISPYFPGITQPPALEWPEHKARFGMSGSDYYAATQRQRELERRIRKTKREIAAMEAQGVGLESPAYVQKRLALGRQQKALREHCEKNNLVRQYDREKAYGVRSQPRALMSAARVQAEARRSFYGRLRSATPTTTTSELAAAESVSELAGMLERKHGVSVSSVDGLDFGSVKDACCGIDEVLSDFPAAKSWLSLSGARLGYGTVMDTSASGRVRVDLATFSDRYGDALSAGRHEAGHLLEVALAAKGKGDPASDFSEAKQAKSVLTAALKAMNKDLAAAGKPKMKLDRAIDSMSSYPAREALATGRTSALYSEGVAVAIELSYNGSMQKSQFTRYVVDQLRKRLS